MSCEAVIINFDSPAGTTHSSMYFLEPLHRIELFRILDDIGVPYRTILPKVASSPLAINRKAFPALQHILSAAPDTNPWGGFQVPKDHESLKALFKGVKAIEAMAPTTSEDVSSEPSETEPHIIAFVYIPQAQRCTVKRLALPVFHALRDMRFLVMLTNNDNWSCVLESPHVQLLREKTICCPKQFNVVVQGFLSFFFAEKLVVGCCRGEQGQC